MSAHVRYCQDLYTQVQWCPHMKVNENNRSIRKDMRVEKELLDIIDSVRGDTSFSAWVRRACVQRLKKEEGIKVVDNIEAPVKRPKRVRTSVASESKSSSNHNGKGSYIYHTPAGKFYGRNPAAEANNLTPHTLAKRCKESYDGYSLEPV